MKMKCDICKQSYEYSEDIIYHYTVIINGELKPHTHICINCFKELKFNIPDITI